MLFFDAVLAAALTRAFAPVFQLFKNVLNGCPSWRIRFDRQLALSVWEGQFNGAV